MTRKKPTLKEELDAALLRIMELEGVEYDRRMVKLQKAGYVRKLFEMDHFPIPVALGGGNHSTNLRPRLKAEHREVTAKKDIPLIAKVARRKAKNDDFIAWRDAIKNGEPVPNAKVSKKAKIKSRGFDKRHHKHMDGTVTRREEEA